MPKMLCQMQIFSGFHTIQEWQTEHLLVWGIFHSFSEMLYPKTIN